MLIISLTHGLGPEKVTYVYVHAFSERASTNQGRLGGGVRSARWERERRADTINARRGHELLEREHRRAVVRRKQPR